MELSDRELLESFAAHRSEDAFRQLVARHLTMVFATARRMLRDTHRAEEVAQSVFLLLTRKAGTIDKGQPLAGWLHHATRHQALHVIRSDARRRQREQTAAAMHPPTTDPEHDDLINELESAMDDLSDEDRDALVLRFLEARSLREVGLELGVSEEAARKRVSRAADRLREMFGKRGITISTGLLTGALAGEAAVAVPVSLGITITSTALAGTAAAGIAVAQGTTTIMSMFNLKTAAAIVGAAAVTGSTTYLVKDQEVGRLQGHHVTLGQSHESLQSEHREALERVKLLRDQIALLQQDVADIHRLRAEVDRLAQLRERLDELTAENERLALELERARQRTPPNSLQTGEEMSPDSILSPAAQEYLYRHGDSNETRLFTRNFTVGADGIATLARLTRNATAAENGAELIQSYLRQNGVELEPPEAAILNEASGLILVRTSLDKLETVQSLLGVLENGQ